MRISTTLLSLIFALFLVSQTLAQYSATESFSYPSGETMDTLGTAGQGWGGPWIIDTSNAKNFGLSVVADTGFKYADMDYTNVPYTGGELICQSPGNWASARYFRPLDKTWPDAKGQYWVSYLFQTQTTPTGNTYYLLKLFSGSNERVAFGKGGGGTTYTCGSGWPGGSGADVSTVEDQGGPVWIVAMINLTGDATADAMARTYMWVNPDPTIEPDTNNADVIRNTNMSSGFDRVAIEFGGADTMQIAYDEIRLGTTFADVSSPLVTPGNLATESFAYNTNATIIGTGSAGNGWADAWHLDPGDTGVSDSLFWVADTGIAFGDMNYDVPHTGNLLIGTLPSTAKYARYERTLAKVWTPDSGTTYWFSVIMELKNDTSSSTWAGVKLAQDHTDAAVMFGKGYGQDLYTVGGGYHASATDPECSTTRWDAGPVWLVGEIFNMGLGNQSPVYMWINPDPSIAPDTSQADARSQEALVPGIAYVRVEYGGSALFTCAFDEIRLGTTFSDVSSPLTKVIKQSPTIPAQFTLSQNYPNPFNPTTMIDYTITKTSKVRLSVYDILGREVENLVNGEQSPGAYEVSFNGAGLASGIYFYRLQSAGNVITKKMILMK